MISLHRGLIRSLHLPSLFTCTFIKSHYEPLAVIHHRHHHMLPGNHRRRTNVPVERIPSVALLKVVLPKHLPLHIKSTEVPALEIGKDMIPIRHR